ncbi:MAG TPA: VIT1/CCC1 transporter family protein [Bryobacteraceae bacterium]|nr:VIT1/CCC1 transporter family protein [Bryobacteraceae bacterium]
MPVTPHIERHFTSSEVVRDIVIGVSDGLTVPFALAAGLSGAVSATRIIVVAGLAEIAAGSIAMGLGGYLAAKSDAEHYASELEREEREVRELPHAERAEVQQILASYGMTEEHARPVLEAFERNPKTWVDWMMRFELGLEAPDPGRAHRSALTIAGSYIAGGLIPLAPYIVLSDAHVALLWSIVATLAALASFGYVKGSFTGAPPLLSAIRTSVIGSLAAAAAFLIAKAVS